jgi:hypothetical protein
MNKIQKMIMSFAAVALIVGGSAFKNNPAPRKTAGWYQPLVSSPILMTSADRLDHSKYDSTPLTTPPSGDCEGNQFVCAAYFSNIEEVPDVIYDRD